MLSARRLEKPQAGVYREVSRFVHELKVVGSGTAALVLINAKNITW